MTEILPLVGPRLRAGALPSASATRSDASVLQKAVTGGKLSFKKAAIRRMSTTNHNIFFDNDIRYCVKDNINI